MKGLIVVTVLLVVLLAGAVVCSRMLGDYRSGLLAAEQREVRARNQEKVDAYNAEVQEYKQSLSSNKANKSWPQPTGEGMEIIDLTTFPLEMPGQVTVNRTDVMMGGLLLVNEWHSRPEDFDESGILSVSGYARNVGLDSFWSNSSIKLHANAIDALVQALTAAKAEGYQNFVIEDAYRTWERQNELFQKQVDAYRASNPSYSEEKLIERAKKRINYPGTIEFNSGLSFSLYIWAKDNAELNNADFIFSVRICVRTRGKCDATTQAEDKG